MKLLFTPRAREDYQYWCDNDKKIAEKIRTLIKDIQLNKNSGLGNPHPLKSDKKGWWARDISDRHRLVYKFKKDELIVSSCYGHYGDDKKHLKKRKL